MDGIVRRTREEKLKEMSEIRKRKKVSTSRNEGTDLA